MRKKYLIPLTLLFIAWLTGCSTGDFDESTDASVAFPASEKRFIKELFDGPYLWYQYTNTSIDPAPYTTPQALIDAYKYARLDHWSFALTEAQFQQFVHQEGGGFGIGFDTGFRVKFVRIDSPAWGKILRGDTILKINGETVTPDRLQAASKALGTPATFTLRRGSSTQTATVTPSNYSYHVTLGTILRQESHTIGYLRYDSFADRSDQELLQRFQAFENAGIDDLVIDLRYNGGGLVDRAVDLMGYINRNHPDETAVHLAWNDRYRSQDTTYNFPSPPAAHSLGLSRVFFLVTRDSASASELVINGLVPYLGSSNIITIGTATHGKNVGMSGIKHGGYYYFLINFYVKNSDGAISPATGISPTCPAQDDLDHPLGDANETLLKTALYYIKNDGCPPAPLSKSYGSGSQPHPILIDGQKSFDGLIAL